VRFIVTKYFPKGSISKQFDLYRGNPIAALKAFKAIVEGVQQIHKAGAIHRDIKPENIFVFETGSLVLGDFGIVFFRDGDRLTETYERAGTRYWMAPWVDRKERIELTKIDATLDIYSLGKLLWFLIAGRDVFSREDFDDPEYNLEASFPNESKMRDINAILGKCVVARKSECLQTALN
jgi:serine/threonine protein kinase